MDSIKSNTIFSRIPVKLSKINTEDDENRKVSYWLEKLHIQGEQLRIDNNRREEQSKIDQRNQLKREGLSNKDKQEIVQSGINQHLKDTTAKSEIDRQTMSDLVKKSNRRIISAKSEFPWNFFPNTIAVEESRVTFQFNQLFSHQSHSVDIKDISNVFIESSMFFATLQIVSRTYIQNDIKIVHLNIKKAKAVQMVIEGLRTFVEHNINTSSYEINELVEKIGEFHTQQVIL